MRWAGSLLAVWPSVALAYSDTTSFARDPSSDTAGGGGGLYFTGSPRQHGLDCGACHIEGPRGTSLKLSALIGAADAELFTRAYQPGEHYELEVAFDGDALVPVGGCAQKSGEPCDLNLFALEILDEAGRPAGSLCPVEPTAPLGKERCGGCAARRARGSLVEDDCTVVLADGFDETALGFRNGATAFSFFWRAPLEDVGPVTVYVSAVDGRGREVPDGEVTSYLHDGVVTVQAPIASPSRRAAPTGCTCARAVPAPGAWLLLLVPPLARRRRVLVSCARSSC